MSLRDREILELNTLCGAVVDGTLTDVQRARLSQLLRESNAARRYYVRALNQSASLQTYAAEIHADAPDQRRQQKALQFPAWAVISLGATAAVVLGLFGYMRPGAMYDSASGATQEYVARITGAKAPAWKTERATLQPGAHLRRGQRLQLNSGYVEITFDSGARVVLEGAATLEINSAWDTTLREGTLKASVPPEAIGFRVRNPFVDVLDLGTEFTVIADAKGGAEVLVNKGEVEAAPRKGGEMETILLREREARRFAENGVSEVDDTVRKFALFAQPLGLERFLPTFNHAHWSFDQVGSALAAGGPLARSGTFDLELFAVAPREAESNRVESPRGRALRFDGQMYAKAQFPRLSGASPRTVAFWVKIPEDAQPLDTWMVGWPTTLSKLGFRPVQIGWNRRPSEGPLGALRTDFGGGHAIGTTSLRDGKWHHVAVYFEAGADDDRPVQVKQYVDGRLESSSIGTGAVRAPVSTPDPSITDTVWLGYRLTGNKQEGRRFRGEIDELFIADRGLQPSEIVALMRENRLPSAVVAHP
jgi:ferric-dicitrate binding protein FerR (iron transport regulator)